MLTELDGDTERARVSRVAMRDETLRAFVACRAAKDEMVRALVARVARVAGIDRCAPVKAREAVTVRACTCHSAVYGGTTLVSVPMRAISLFAIRARVSSVARVHEMVRVFSCRRNVLLVMLLLCAKRSAVEHGMTRKAPVTDTVLWHVRARVSRVVTLAEMALIRVSCRLTTVGAASSKEALSAMVLVIVWIF